MEEESVCKYGGGICNSCASKRGKARHGKAGKAKQRKAKQSKARQARHAPQKPHNIASPTSLASTIASTTASMATHKRQKPTTPFTQSSPRVARKPRPGTGLRSRGKRTTRTPCRRGTKTSAARPGSWHTYSSLLPAVIRKKAESETNSVRSGNQNPNSAPADR